jgi:hypothetical protein
MFDDPNNMDIEDDFVFDDSEVTNITPLPEPWDDITEPDYSMNGKDPV